MREGATGIGLEEGHEQRVHDRDVQRMDAGEEGVELLVLAGASREDREREDRQVRPPATFRLPGARAFLLAAVREGNRFSTVTTRPNASVAHVHNRMPLVLGPGESSVWLGPDFANLSNRDAIRLSAVAERWPGLKEAQGVR